VLSRIAESFFWIGRYVERAEATARLLAEHHQLIVEDRTLPEDVACAVVLDALSLSHVDVATSGDLVHALVGGAGQPSTVAGAVTAARENARAVRDALSGELFEALNSTHLALGRGLAFGASPGVALYRVLERLLVVRGVIDWTMPRDEAYLFLELGRSLERIDMVSRLLSVRHDQLWPESGPLATLRAAGAFSAFLRSGMPTTGEEARVFLVLDDTFPRSMRRCAADAEAAVRGLEREGVRDDGDLLREVGMLRSSLEFAVNPDPEAVDHLSAMGRRSAGRASDAVAHAFFRPAGTIVWSH
jgi:uncharacterized alpha-E superfamily protein